MLPKGHRLNLRTGYRWVSSGKRIESDLLKLRLKYQDRNLEPIIGIAVPSKVFRKAYQRNRVKRLVSGAFEKLYPRLTKGIYILALPKVRVFEVQSVEVEEDLKKVLSKEGVIN